MSSKIKPRLSLARIDIQHREDPLKLFYSGIKSEETKSAYKKTYFDPRKIEKYCVPAQN